jgi:hypothetical protein
MNKTVPQDKIIHLVGQINPFHETNIFIPWDGFFRSLRSGAKIRKHSEEAVRVN